MKSQHKQRKTWLKRAKVQKKSSLKYFFQGSDQRKISIATSLSKVSDLNSGDSECSERVSPIDAWHKGGIHAGHSERDQVMSQIK